MEENPDQAGLHDAEEPEHLARVSRPDPGISGHSVRPTSVSSSQRPTPLPIEQMSRQTTKTSQITEQQIYLLKVCRALMSYGAPTHRLEEYMRMTAEVLQLQLQSFYVPGCMIISFKDAMSSSSEVRIVRCSEALNLSKLYDVHAVYKDVVHQRTTIVRATARLDDILAKADNFPQWLRVLMYGLASACIGPVSYGARPIDLPIIFILGTLLGFKELILAHRSELYAHVFDISAAILISFLARAFGSIPSGSGTLFCFSAICQASLVMILPGFTITSSALELQSKNIVSGSVRMVYAVIFTMFLGFGITIGSAIYGAMDSRATSATKCATEWPFWWQVIFVAPFTLCYIIIRQGKWSKVPDMLVVSLIGWLVSHFSSQGISPNAQIAQTLGQTLGALAIGIIANLWSRLGHGLAVALMHPAIYIQVPGSLAASGGLISGVRGADQLTQHHSEAAVNQTSGPQNMALLNSGYSMIEIAIGITVGLSVSALVVYPMRKDKGKSGLFSF